MTWKQFVRQTNLLWENIYSLEEAKVIVVGVPFDSTTTGLPGTRLGPSRIREEFRMWASSYDPDLGLLDDVILYDIGDIEAIPGNPKGTLDRIYQVIRGVIEENPSARLITLGGEHSITFPIIKAMVDAGKSFDYLCFDAHWDLLDDFFGLKESHAAVNRRIMDLIGPERMEIIGPRIGEKEEWDLAKNLGKVKDPIYLSIDLDVLDGVPVGTPVPGGIDFKELWSKIKGREWLAADVVEYNPMLGTSPIPAELLRKLLLMTR